MIRDRLPLRPIRPLPAALACATSALLCVAGACSRVVELSEPRPTPNVVLIVVDTLRAEAILDPTGRVDTPRIDGLAADGVQFSKCFSHAPMTLPAHTSLFSSRPPHASGVLGNRFDVPERLALFPEHLAGAGYQTAAVASLGTLRFGTGVGLDRGIGHAEKAFQRIWLAQAPAVLEKSVEALDALDTSKPFFLFAHFSDPHEPYNAHGSVRRTAELSINGESVGEVLLSDMAPWSETIELAPGPNTVEITSKALLRVQSLSCRGADNEVTWETDKRRTTNARATIDIQADEPQDVLVDVWLSDNFAGAQERDDRYDQEVEFSDRHVGQLLDELERRGLYDDALIIFTSDHGEALGEHSFSGHIQNVYDELIHVPLIVKLPAGDSRRAALDALRDVVVPHIDVVPTLLELLEIRALEGQLGSSLLERERGERVVIAETHRPLADRDLICIRDGELKLIYDIGAETFEMYDIVADPAEQVDVFEERRDDRPDWPDRLRAAAAAARSVEIAGVSDPETEAQLEALGYAVGGDE